MFGLPGGWEWIVILAIALLIFGRKLPETARGLGKGIVEFKKGLKGVEDEVEEADRRLELEAKKEASAKDASQQDPARA